MQLNHRTSEFSGFSGDVVGFLKQLSQSTLLVTSNDLVEKFQYEAQNLITLIQHQYEQR